MSLPSVVRVHRGPKGLGRPIDRVTGLRPSGLAGAAESVGRGTRPRRPSPARMGLDCARVALEAAPANGPGRTRQGADGVRVRLVLVVVGRVPVRRPLPGVARHAPGAVGGPTQRLQVHIDDLPEAAPVVCVVAVKRVVAAANRAGSPRATRRAGSQGSGGASSRSPGGWSVHGPHTTPPAPLRRGSPNAVSPPSSDAAWTPPK